MKHYLLRSILFIALAVPATQVSAQQLLTPEDAIAAALEKNYDIKLVRNDSTSFAVDYQYSYAGFLPRINGTASKTWNVNRQKQELSNGTKRDTSGIQSNNLSASIGLNWTLFDGLKMFATRERLKQFQALGELTVKNQVVNTVADVLVNYYNIVRQKQQLRAIEEQMSINEERVKIADQKIYSGLGSKPELLQAKVDLNAQKASRLEQLTLIGQLRDQLNQLIGLNVGDVYEVLDSIPFNTGLSLGELTQNIDQTNPALLLTRKNIDIAGLVLKERRAELWPTLSLNTSYNLSRNVNKAVINTFTPLFNQNLGFNYGFGLSVPILNGFNTRRLIKQAELDIAYQETFYDNQRSLINVAISNAFKDYVLQKDLLQLEEENIQLAKENVAIALARFKQGLFTNLELREAQISLEQGYNRLIAARYNTKLAETELLRQKGELIITR
ncbi:MAG: TolC family protein [Chitinophagaceae bacterium]